MAVMCMSTCGLSGIDTTCKCTYGSLYSIELGNSSSYLLGLLAMIKCSICSYQCDSWYVSNWGLACHINLFLGRVCLELAPALLSVALAWHFARCSTPSGWIWYASLQLHQLMSWCDVTLICFMMPLCNHLNTLCMCYTVTSVSQHYHSVHFITHQSFAFY